MSQQMLRPTFEGSNLAILGVVRQSDHLGVRLLHNVNVNGQIVIVSDGASQSFHSV